MRKKILIIDDDIIYRKIIQNLLCSEYQLTFAQNLEEIIDVLEIESVFDLIIADMNLPGISGIDLIRVIFEKTNNKIPIIVISGMDDDNLKQTLFKMGVSEFLIKPIDRKELRLKLIEFV